MAKFEIHNMDLYYNTFHALKNINLELPANEVSAFIGPSGCGKSTLLKSLNRMNDLVEGCKITGDIRLDGEDIYGDIDVNLLRKRVGMVFQNAEMQFFTTTVDKSALGMSGGQQQRLCIARALAVHPEVLLMDEPTSALDPISTSKVEDLVISLKKEYTIIIVTHNMQQATRVSDRTAFFLLGEVIEYAETEQLFSNPQDKRTEDYISGRFG